MQHLKTIGSKIADARKKHNYSQADLANHLSISPQAVGKWERGESSPDIATFFRIAEILKVDLNYFSSQTQQEENKTGTEIIQEETPNLSKSNSRKLNWNMSEGNWVDVDFSGLKNLKEKFSYSNMKNCKFLGSDLSGLLLSSNNIELCDFSSSDLCNSTFHSSNLSKNNFNYCNLQDSEFTMNNLEDCDFTGSNLTGALFSYSSISKNIVVDSIWKLTSFSLSSIRNIVFNGTIEECSFENCSFSNVTFQNATILFTFFKGKKLKGIKFIDCKVDQITYEFLKNGKADLTGVTVISG